MPTFYMIFWSVVMVLAMGMWRLRSWRGTAVVALVTFLILVFSQALFAQLSQAAGVDPSLAFTAPELYMRGGPAAWLALLVMPCGWLGPIIGSNLVLRSQIIIEPTHFQEY